MLEKTMAESKEVSIVVSQGTLRAKSWFDNQDTTIVFLHGWLDNANSFDDLISHFPDYHCLAIDLMGHGLSDHRQSPYYVWEFAMDIAEWIQKLEKPVHIVGHSLGAGVAFLTAPLVQDKYLSLCFLEGITPVPNKSSDFAEQYTNFWKEETRPIKTYKDFSDLVKSRQLSPIAPLDEPRARQLMQRSSKKTEQGFVLISDPKLRHSSAVKMNREQILSIAKKISCPSYALCAHQGLLKKVPSEVAQSFSNLKEEAIDGDHHFHMGDNSLKVAEKLRSFIESLPQKA